MRRDDRSDAPGSHSSSRPRLPPVNKREDCISQRELPRRMRRQILRWLDGVRRGVWIPAVCALLSTTKARKIVTAVPWEVRGVQECCAFHGAALLVLLHRALCRYLASDNSRRACCECRWSHCSAKRRARVSPLASDSPRTARQWSLSLLPSSTLLDCESLGPCL